MSATYASNRVRYAATGYDYLGNPHDATGDVEVDFGAVQTVEAVSEDEHSVEVVIS